MRRHSGWTCWKLSNCRRWDQGAKSHLHGPDKAGGVSFANHYQWLYMCSSDVNHASNAQSCFGWVFQNEEESWESQIKSIQQQRDRRRGERPFARKACCSTSSLVSRSCWLMIWVKGMNIPCASGNCTMAACFALTRTRRWQRAWQGFERAKAEEYAQVRLPPKYYRLI